MAKATRNYEILLQAISCRKINAKSLSQAQVALKQSRIEVVLNMEHGDEVDEFYSLEELKAALTRPEKSSKFVSAFRVREFPLLSVIIG